MIECNGLGHGLDLTIAYRKSCWYVHIGRRIEIPAMTAVCSSAAFPCGGANSWHSERELPNGSSRQRSGHSGDLSLIHSHARRRAFCLALFSRAGFLFVSHDWGQKDRKRVGEGKS